MVDWIEVRRRLIQRREAAGLTGKEAAAQAGVSNSYVSNLENGIATPGAVVLFAALAVAYKTSVDYLLGITDNAKPSVSGAMSPQTERILHIMAPLSAAAQDVIEELVATFAAHEIRRAEDTIDIDQTLAALEAMLGRKEFDDLVAILERGLATGDTTDTRRQIVRLLAPDDESESQEKE